MYCPLVATCRTNAQVTSERDGGSKATAAGRSRSLPGRCTFRYRSRVWGGDDRLERHRPSRFRVFRRLDRVRAVSLILSTVGLRTSFHPSSPPSLLDPKRRSSLARPPL